MELNIYRVFAFVYSPEVISNERLSIADQYQENLSPIKPGYVLAVTSLCTYLYYRITIQPFHSQINYVYFSVKYILTIKSVIITQWNYNGSLILS